MTTSWLQDFGFLATLEERLHTMYCVGRFRNGEPIFNSKFTHEKITEEEVNQVIQIVKEWALPVREVISCYPEPKEEVHSTFGLAQKPERPSITQNFDLAYQVLDKTEKRILLSISTRQMQRRLNFVNREPFPELKKYEVEIPAKLWKRESPGVYIFDE